MFPECVLGNSNSYVDAFWICPRRLKIWVRYREGFPQNTAAAHLPASQLPDGGWEVTEEGGKKMLH